MNVTIGNKKLKINCTYNEGQLIKREIPFDGRASGWNKATKTWQLPDTPAYRRRLIALFGDVVDKPSGDIRCVECKYKTKPWAHQYVAFEFSTLNKSALLHMHMGTGKTKVVYDVIASCGYEKILVLAPKKTVRGVWPKQYETHSFADIRLYPLSKHSTAKRAQTMTDTIQLPGAKMYILNYEAAWRRVLAAAILSVDWDLLIMDESHRIKSPTGKASMFCAKINAGHRLALTGTPLPHSPLDIFAQYRALDCGVFGNSWSKFRNRYAVMGGYAVNGRAVQVVGYQNGEEMTALIDSIRIEVKQDVLDLPEIQFIDMPVELDAITMTHYRQLENLFITEIKDTTVTASNALVKMLRLQQITSGYVPDGEGTAVPVGTEKADTLEELLSGIGDEPCVVFCRFTHDLAAVHRVCRNLKIDSFEISGKADDLADWDHGVVAVQIQAGGEGIDLTLARYAIYFSLGYSLGQYEQSIARIHRPGQSRPVIIYRLIAEKTIDEKIISALKKRKKVVEEILDSFEREEE